MFMGEKTGHKEVWINNTGALGGYIDISFTNKVDDDFSCTPAESFVDASCGAGLDGELAENVTITSYIDEDLSGGYNGGDTLIYNGTIAAAGIDALVNHILNSGAARKVGIDYLVTNLSVGVKNQIQSDRAGFDMEFELAQTAGQ